MPFICEACNHESPDTALFCAGCGRPVSDSSAAGSLIGREILGTYQLVKLLGKGGMSVVYLARHVLTEQEVAVKVLPPELASQQELKARFIEEARALARLEHPNVVVLHNFKEEENHLYLVMQYAEGDTFETIIEREGRLEVADAVDVVVEVLRALEYAHERGVIHRDIKPSNIIIRGDGSVKVMDFGLAKYVGSTKLTQTGLTMGTVRYMSPEQVRGKQVDHRSDLYSLGITLYEAVAGRTPFDGETHFEIMAQHLQNAPPPLGELADVPPLIEEAIAKALMKRAENRFQSAKEFRHALEQAPLETRGRRKLISEPVHAAAATPTPAPRRRTRLNIVPIGLAVALLLISGAAVIWASLEPPPRSTRQAEARAAPSPRRPLWPEPHPLTRKLQWKVDERFEAPAFLHVLSMKQLDAAALRDTYIKARERYREFLHQEGIMLDYRIGPLNLAIVDQEVLNSREHWPDAKDNVDYPTRYEAPTATLFVHDGPRFVRTDLCYGLAIHFCARIAKLSNERCMELAEGFERYSSRR